jgi:NADPH-dependent 2,4-dienoyl-CoA reductase/sulfur reductase-like enzyme
VNTICLGYGFEPANEILRALDCAHDFDPARGHLVTRRDADGATTITGVFALGDCTDLGGARAAQADGVIVGHAAARRAGFAGSADRQAAEHAARAVLRRQRVFQTALWRLFATDVPTPLGRLTKPDTLICRCEEVTLGSIEAAFAAGTASAAAVKQDTRAGMGRCQARYCAPILDALAASHNATGRDEFSGFAPRLPVKPVVIADLARLGGKP